MLVVSSKERLIASSFCLRMLISAFSNRLLSYSALKIKIKIFKKIFPIMTNCTAWERRQTQYRRSMSENLAHCSLIPLISYAAPVQIHLLSQQSL